MPLLLKISLLYITGFAAAGAYLPFFQLYLSGQGLSPSAVSFGLMLFSLSTLISGPLLAFHIQKSDKPHLYLAVAALITFVLYVMLQQMSASTAIVAMMFFIGFFNSFSMPLTESYAVTASQVHPRLDYGKMRLFGSGSFMLSGILCGWLLDLWGTSTIILPYIYIFVFLLSVTAWFLPKLDTSSVYQEHALSVSGVWELLKNKDFLFVIVGLAIIHAAHGINFSSISVHWNKIGYSGTTISLLWSIGVLAEMVFFWTASSLEKHLSIRQMFGLVAVGSIMRWGGMAFDPSLPFLFVLQAGHAFTFGAMHLSAIRFIKEYVPINLQYSGQILYTTFLWGVFMAPSLWLSGTAYEYLHTDAYWLMVALVLVGTASVFMFKPKKVLP